MPIVVLKLFSRPGIGRTDGQSGDYMLPPFGSIIKLARLRILCYLLAKQDSITQGLSKIICKIKLLSGHRLKNKQNTSFMSKCLNTMSHKYLCPPSTHFLL